jgi:TetR/AcrR family transcriptional repressor of mexJK operon
MPLDVFAPSRPSESRPTWLGPLNDPRNEAILVAAFQVFVEKGLSGATMLEIATRAKVSKETLYDRFDSREGLFYALMAWGARQTACKFDDFEARLAADPVRTMEDLIRDTLTAMLHEESIAVRRIAMSAAFQMPDVGLVYSEMTCGVGLPMIRELGAALSARGVAQIDDLDAFADAFIGLMRGNLVDEVCLRVRPIPDEVEIAARAKQLTHRVLRAFAA